VAGRAADDTDSEATVIRELRVCPIRVDDDHHRLPPSRGKTDAEGVR